MAVLAYTYTPLKALRFLTPLFIALVIIPIQEQLFLAFSFPLRLISTILTVETLQLFGSNLSYELTSIRGGSFEVAITDACSGISQLAVLFLLTYIVVVLKQHRSPWYATLHYLSLLPIVIFANVIRLMLTILLFYVIGEKAFSNSYHALLGYAFVLLAIGLVYGIGALFPEKPSIPVSSQTTPNLSEEM
jgi:exosortase/archaeosortase family protein